MNYPDVYSEHQTMTRAASGASLTRFGDGELRLARGGQSVSQKPSAFLAKELRSILAGDYAKHALTCIPNLQSPIPSPHMPFYRKYGAPAFVGMYGPQAYGSTWCSRADAAPWIDSPDYWGLVASIWRGTSAVAVAGKLDMGNLMHATGAAQVHYIPAPVRDAYFSIDELIERVGKPAGPVVISLGAAGTVLAARLAKRGVWAIDLGHIHMFMNEDNQGAFAFTLDDFASPAYRNELRAAHADHFGSPVKGKWGRSGSRHWPLVKEFADRLQAKWILDYGSGAETFAPEAIAAGYRVEMFDVGTDKIALPKQVDVSFSSDVLEHVEPEKIENVMRFLYLIARKGGWHKIALKPANKILPLTGRNAHILLRSPDWWEAAFKAAGWKTVKRVLDTHKHVTFECTK